MRAYGSLDLYTYVSVCICVCVFVCVRASLLVVDVAVCVRESECVELFACASARTRSVRPERSSLRAGCHVGDAGTRVHQQGEVNAGKPVFPACGYD